MLTCNSIILLLETETETETDRNKIKNGKKDRRKDKFNADTEIKTIAVMDNNGYWFILSYVTDNQR